MQLRSRGVFPPVCATVPNGAGRCDDDPCPLADVHRWGARLVTGSVNLTGEKKRSDIIYISIHLFILQLYYPIRVSPMGNSGRFPRGKPAATELRYLTTVHGGFF